MFRRISHYKIFSIALLIFIYAVLYSSILFACGNSVTVSWIPPEINFNGTPLTDISGYKLYYGNDSKNYNHVINVGNKTAYEIVDLTEGLPYYFAVTAYDTSGNESAYSYEVSKIIVPSTNPPVANAGGAYSNAEGQSTTLNGSGSSDPDGNIVRYEWDVNNDGIYDYFDASAKRSHTYARQGVYIIKLRVTDNLGATSEAVAEAYISDTSPIAGFTANPTSGTVPLTVNFSNTSQGYDKPLAFEWDFDNNGTIDATVRTPSYTYTKPGTYTVKLTVRDTDGSRVIFTRANYITVDHAYALDCDDGGGVKCLERTDGGSDSDNLVNGKPRLNREYEFRLKVKDISGRTPQYVKLYMTQRNHPEADDFYGYRMTCSGNFNTGGLCTYITKLGPAAAHKFYFETKFYDGAVFRYPDTGYLSGPVVELLTGYNLVGIPRDTGNDLVGGYSAFGSTVSYRWNAGGYYTAVTKIAPVRQGEGYYIQKQAGTLSELAEYGETQDAEKTYEIKPGWNIISNPYSGNIRLSGLKVRKGNSVPVSWIEASSSGWISNAISYNNGADWGNAFISESAPQATLVPWMGYWMYLNKTDDVYYLLIPKPFN